jgi:hypothetical protein
MTVTALGTLTVGAAVPGMSTAITAGVAGINAVLPDLVSRLAMLAALPPIVPGFDAQLALATDMAASATSAMHLGLPLPDIAAALAAALAALEALVSLVQGQLATIVALQGPLASAGVGAYVFDGARDQLGYELGAAIGPGANHANALLLVTLDPAAWAALSAIVKVTP